jgi:hypothetical protein
MKLLLLGDYSGFFKNLKEGLLELGHDVKIATTSDGYKKTTKTDIFIPGSESSSLARKVNKMKFPLSGIKDYYGYDVVHLINHNIFGGLKIKYNYMLLNRIKSKNDRMTMSACGTDHFVFKNKDRLRYNYIDSNIEIDLQGENKYIRNEYKDNNERILALSDAVIPVMYSYAEAYRNTSKILNTIPMPINLGQINFIPQKLENNKLKIFHGITREGFKGTKYIREAMERLKENYPNDVEIVIDGKMPLDKYLKVLKKTNVVVDQALSYEYGMNAIYSMAMGKVVLSGNEPECQQEFGRTDIPIINITPSVKDIYHKLEQLVLDKKRLIEIGENSRRFVEDFHDHVKVAQQYVDTWNSIEVNKRHG